MAAEVDAAERARRWPECCSRGRQRDIEAVVARNQARATPEHSGA
jgi:hypothetical protein